MLGRQSSEPSRPAQARSCRRTRSATCAGPGPSSRRRVPGGSSLTQSARMRWLEPRKSLRAYRLAEKVGMSDPLLVELVAQQHPENGESVPDAAPEPDLRGLVEVAGGDRDLADAQPFPHTLGDDL